MANKYWQGGAAAVANAWTATPANVEVGDIFALSCAGASVSYTAAAATVADVTAGLTAAWNASTHPAHKELTATDDTTHVTLTGDTAGVPHTLSGSAVNGGSTDDQTLNVVETTAATGPHHIDEPQNWHDGVLPINNDTIYISANTPPIYYGTLASVNPVEVAVEAGTTIGLPSWHVNPVDPTTGYREYRATHIPIGCAIDGAFYITRPARCFLDVGTTQPVCYVQALPGALEDGASVRITGSGSGIDVYLSEGRLWTDKAVTTSVVGRQKNTVGTTTVATFDSTIGTLTVIQGDAYGRAPSTALHVDGTDARFHFTAGDSCTLSTIFGGGEIVMENAAPVYTATARFTTLHIGDGTLTCNEPHVACSVTTLHLYAGAKVYDPHGRLDVSNDIQLHECTLADVTFDSAHDASFDHKAYSGAS
jgi:hypothetical protein